MYSHFFRDSLKKIPAAGRKDIQQNPLLQAYGAVHQPGRHDNGISGREFCAFPLHGVAEMPGEDIAALGVGVGVVMPSRVKKLLTDSCKKLFTDRCKKVLTE